MDRQGFVQSTIPHWLTVKAHLSHSREFGEDKLECRSTVGPRSQPRKRGGPEGMEHPKNRPMKIRDTRVTSCMKTPSPSSILIGGELFLLLLLFCYSLVFC